MEPSDRAGDVLASAGLLADRWILARLDEVFETSMALRSGRSGHTGSMKAVVVGERDVFAVAKSKAAHSAIHRFIAH